MKIQEIVTETMSQAEIKQFEKDIQQVKKELAFTGIQRGFKQMIPTDDELNYRLTKAKERLARHKAREKNDCDCSDDSGFTDKKLNAKTRQMAKRAKSKKRLG
jgi:uncharacterized protein involved in exopolysaccharide biosynthesis